MRRLLDTCIVYDWLMGVFDDAGTIEAVQRDGALVSPVSVWEMAIKHRLGKLALPTLRPADDIEAQGFTWLPVTAAHAQQVFALPDHHRDPFDRLLVAQAIVEQLTIITYDRVFAEYLPGAVQIL